MFHRLLSALVLALVPMVAAAQQAPPQDPLRVYRLEDFGPTDAANLQGTWETAHRQLRQSGGLLMLPAEWLPRLKPLALQGLHREPAAPAETKNWRSGAGITLLSIGPQQAVLRVPPLDGARIERTLALDEGDSLPHWGTHPVLTIDSRLIYGSVSYLDWLQAPVSKGPDQRFYLPTVRGLHPGQFLNIHGGPGYGGGVTRAYVKALGYDPQKQQHYLVADTSQDHTAGAILHNKSNTGLIHMLQTSHADNQTYDVKVIRNQYAHGDTYIYYCDFNYMSNVHSAAGDENGNCFSAFIRSMDNNFHASVESVDWQSQQLVFHAARNADTLGNSRPLINRNPKKHLTRGNVWIVPAECYLEPIDTGTCRFEGKTYPTRLVKNPVTGVSELKMGGLIRGDADCPWGPEVVGRFFAVDETSEKTPQGNYRWYQITRFRANDDGTKEIEIARFWWGAKSAGSPTLYRRDNYTWDGHLRPLRYIIAPGTYVNDVSRAVPGTDRGNARTLGLAPYAEAGSPLDFAPGDAIEQAIGPDPFKPQPMRVWMWEDVPGPFPSAVFDLANHGAASRYSAMTIAGGPATLEECQQRHEAKPAWDNVLVFHSAVGVGINCKADFAEAAILFEQPNREQPIKWHYDRQPGAPPKEAVLTVDRDSGEFRFRGAGIRTNGPITAAAGLSGDEQPARNLRGKNVAVDEGSRSVKVAFPRAESDGEYAVFLELSWLTNRAVTEKTADGFTVQFDQPAPAGAKLDWMLVR